jgi:probable rRNA maturation factor
MALYISRSSIAVPLSREMEALLRKAARLSILRMKGNPSSEIGLILLDDSGIRALNRDYRGIDRATDVLSFPISERMVGHAGAYPMRLLGDIAISTERAAEQAVSYGHSFRREMAFLMVHGMLHLLGLDHEADAERAHMEKLQKQILWALGVSR